MFSSLLTRLVILAIPVCCALALNHVVLPALFSKVVVHEYFGGAESYKRFLDQHDNRLDQVRFREQTIMAFAENIPSDLDALAVNEKTELFVLLILGDAVRVNEEIAEQKAELKRLMDKRHSFSRLTSREQWWLNRLAGEYLCDPGDQAELLLRVDTIPIALVLAQAIEESGWGTSRFAIQGNGLYGLHYHDKSRDKFMHARLGSVRVAAFDTVGQATGRYIRNLNVSKAYRELRTLRKAMRDDGVPVTGYELAAELSRYSERGDKYVDNLRYLMRRYDLVRLNDVSLINSLKVYTLKFSRTW